MTDKFDKTYNKLMDLKTKLDLVSEDEKKVIEKEVKELEYILAYMEYLWLYE